MLSLIDYFAGELIAQSSLLHASFFVTLQLWCKVESSAHCIKLLLRKKCPYSELFWSVFSRIRTEYGEIRSISQYSIRMRENTDQENPEYG